MTEGPTHNRLKSSAAISDGQKTKLTVGQSAPSHTTFGLGIPIRMSSRLLEKLSISLSGSYLGRGYDTWA